MSDWSIQMTNRDILTRLAAQPTTPTTLDAINEIGRLRQQLVSAGERYQAVQRHCSVLTDRTAELRDLVLRAFYDNDADLSEEWKQEVRELLAPYEGAI